MSLDVWFREDIKNALLAILQASSTSTGGYEDPELQQAYRAGVVSGMVSLGVLFGLRLVVTNWTSCNSCKNLLSPPGDGGSRGR